MEDSSVSQAIEEGFTVFGMDPEILTIKVVYLVVVVAVAFFVQRALVKLCRKALSKLEFLPSATIIVNSVRIAVWVVALLLTLYPVFGQTPSAVLTALGVVSIALSLGLKDTISNIFGGIMLMVGRVVHPGDYVTISGVTGTVVDVTMRHTVVENRIGEHVIIPNSVLNTTSIQRLPATSESILTIEFTMKAGLDPNLVAEDLVSTVAEAGEGFSREGMPPKVIFDSVTPYGIKGQVYFYVKEGVPFSGVRNTLVRAVAQKEYFSCRGSRALAAENREEDTEQYSEMY